MVTVTAIVCGCYQVFFPTLWLVTKKYNVWSEKVIFKKKV